jgi:hypothetical protein
MLSTFFQFVLGLRSVVLATEKKLRENLRRSVFPVDKPFNVRRTSANDLE